MTEEISRAAAMREAVGIIDDPQTVERAVAELMTAGFDRSDISILATEDTVRGKLGSYYQDMRAAEDDPRAPRQSWVEPESRTVGQSALTGILGYIGAVTAGGVAFATGGAAAVVIAAGVVGAGVVGGVGFRLARLIDEKVGSALQVQLDHGGIVVWVRVDNDDEAALGSAVLNRHGARDVHVHQILVPTE